MPVAIDSIKDLLSILVSNLEPFAAATLTDRTCAKADGMMNERELDDRCRPLDAKNMLDAIIDILNLYYSQINLKLGDVLWREIFRNRSISPSSDYEIRH